MDFSVRKSPLYISLGPNSRERRRVFNEGAPSTRLEQFLGSRFHGFSTIASIESGRGWIEGAFGRIPVETGDVIVLPPGTITYAFSGTRRVETLALSRDLSIGAIVRATSLPRDCLSLPDDALRRALRDAPARRTFSRSQPEQALMRALEIIADDPPIARLPQIAHVLGYTSDGLRALMHRRTGRGFAQWRDALTMARVRGALDRATPVAEIARRLAVESHYLHRRFARAHGTTPRAWQKSPTLPVSAIAHDWDDVARFFATTPRDERTSHDRPPSR